MVIVKHELRQGFKSFCIWTASIAFFIIVCIFMFPEMEKEMSTVTDMFASMGSFTAAFGMDRLNFGTLIGFYSIECGSILGIGGSLFAALISVSSLAKEEKDHTAEFLLTHPVSRVRVLSEKLISIFLQIVLMNLILWLISIVSILLVNETIPWEDFHLIHLAFLVLELEIASICFGISAFLHRSGIGIGLGLAITMYFMNIIANISDSVQFLKYITPFSYTDGADIVASHSLNTTYVLCGVVYAIIGIGLAYWKYTKKDIHS